MLACLLLVPAAAAAQPVAPRVEVSGSVAAAHVFRIEDESFGTALNAGMSFEWRALPSLGVGAEVNRVTGLEPDAIDCNAVPGVSCTGTGREGVLSATLMSVTAAWHFGASRRAQPYLIGGMNVVWSRTLSSVTFGSGSVRTISEIEQHDRGMGITAGVGVRVPVGDRVIIRPEWRIYDGSLMGRANLSIMRTSVAIGYGW
jgi:opacity protein-like surface antigen